MAPRLRGFFCVSNPGMLEQFAKLCSQMDSFHFADWNLSQDEWKTYLAQTESNLSQDRFSYGTSVTAFFGKFFLFDGFVKNSHSEGWKNQVYPLSAILGVLFPFS